MPPESNIMSSPVPGAFRRTELLLGEDAVAALAHERVAVFGLGGVGAWCAEALARSGVGHLLIVDDDTVAPSNLNRQLPATVHTIGRAKAEVMRERLLAINPAIDLTVRAERYTPENAGTFTLPPVVVDAIDSVDCKAHLIRHATDLEGVKLFSSMGAASRLDPARIRATAFGKVAGDGLARALRQRFKRDQSWPSHEFTCVWSDEPPLNRGNRREEDGKANGSWMPVTAAFGLRLAALALDAMICAPSASHHDQ